MATIGALAKATGVKIETIRYYERIGLLPVPPRTKGNYRSYGRDAERRLHFIKRTRNHGFSIEEIHALLDLSDQKQHRCSVMDEISCNHLATIEGKIADLTRLAEELRRLNRRCRGGGTIKDCGGIDSLFRA